MEDLLKLREEIDIIDNEIVSLYEKRMKIAEGVARFKIETGKKVFSGDELLAALEAMLFAAGYPLEYEKLKDVTVKTDGVYVYCAVGEKAEEIAAIFDKYFN